MPVSSEELVENFQGNSLSMNEQFGFAEFCFYKFFN